MSASSCLQGPGPDFSIEAEFFSKGYRFIAGIDEAGRGALAGPLSVGMVIYDSSLFCTTAERTMVHVDDSKKLTHKKRVSALETVRSRALSVSYVFIPHSIIDRTNINIATFMGIEKLLEKSPVSPDIIIMDGNFKFNLKIPFVPVIKGDSRSLSISSASIAAKVNRDLIMDMLDIKFPHYGFASNKGYGTRSHLAAIGSAGVSPVHRLSYEPVKSLYPGCYV
jgi:ribonuclease HII